MYPYQLAYNVVPGGWHPEADGYNEEEVKIVNETRKILHMPELRITATCVHPGMTVTERIPAMLAEQAAARGVSEDEVRRGLESTTSLRRLITAAEVADVVTFLASPRSVAITGDSIGAGGGQPGVVHY